MNDTYKTISQPSEEILYKEKNSKFYAYAFPVTTEDQVKNYLELLRKKHFGAVHFCYAYQIGTHAISYRANDDGEPSNTAGMPIYGQIQSFDVTNILVVVVRFFGGIKLGVGGLISAYRESAKMALEKCKIIERTIDIHYIITFDYKNMNKVMRIIKEKNITIISQKMNENCQIEIAVRKKNASIVLEAFQSLFEVTIEEKK